MKKITRNIVIGLAILLVLALSIVGVMHHLEVKQFEEEQLKADMILTETAWYADLVDSIKTQLPADAEGATGHVRHILLLENDENVDLFDLLVPFWGYQYVEELPLGLHRVHFVRFDGLALQVALMEWSQGQRTEAPELILSELEDGTPALALAPYDPLFTQNKFELWNRWFDLLGNFYGELNGII